MKMTLSRSDGALLRMRVSRYELSRNIGREPYPSEMKQLFKGATRVGGQMNVNGSMQCRSERSSTWSRQMSDEQGVDELANEPNDRGIRRPASVPRSSLRRADEPARLVATMRSEDGVCAIDPRLLVRLGAALGPSFSSSGTKAVGGPDWYTPTIQNVSKCDRRKYRPCRPEKNPCKTDYPG